MKLFSPEGQDCTLDEGKTLVDALKAFLDSGDTDKLKDLGSLTISFEGDKRQVGFFHRYDVSCSTTITPTPTSPDPGGMSMFKTRQGDTPSDSKQCAECVAECFMSKTLSGKAPCSSWETDTGATVDRLKSFISSARFSRGSVKLDWVRIGLLGGVVLLFIFLVASLLRGGSSAY